MGESSNLLFIKIVFEFTLNIYNKYLKILVRDCGTFGLIYLTTDTILN
jgi:hypothetical protein